MFPFGETKVVRKMISRRLLISRNLPMTFLNKNDKKGGMKKVFKILALIGAIALLPAGIGSFFMESPPTGYGLLFITWGILMIWYWGKK